MTARKMRAIALKEISSAIHGILICDIINNDQLSSEEAVIVRDYIEHIANVFDSQYKLGDIK